MKKKEKISQRVSREILGMIEDGTFPPGAKLPTEMELAARFEVSRMPIREALSMLRAAGVVTSRQGGGSYVEETIHPALLHSLHLESNDVGTIKYLFEVRRMLEPEAAALAAKRRTPEQLEEMRKALLCLKQEESEKSDIAFHRALVLAAQNTVLTQVIDHLASLYERVLTQTLRPNEALEQKRRLVYQEHEAIFKAIEAGEPELARVLSDLHLKNAEKKLSVLLPGYTD